MITFLAMIDLRINQLGVKEYSLYNLRVNIV